MTLKNAIRYPSTNQLGGGLFILTSYCRPKGVASANCCVWPEANVPFRRLGARSPAVAMARVQRLGRSTRPQANRPRRQRGFMQQLRGKGFFPQKFKGSR